MLEAVCIPKPIHNCLPWNTYTVSMRYFLHHLTISHTHTHTHTLSHIYTHTHTHTHAHTQDVNAVDRNDWTAVHCASFHGRLGCLQLLMRWGGKLDGTDNAGNTAGQCNCHSNL